MLLLVLQNEDAEELMRQVEREEEAAAAADPEGLQLHLCIINLVIGTLYCSKVQAAPLMRALQQFCALYKC
jgi:tetratricopeptide repeat protein 30